MTSLLALRPSFCVTASLLVSGGFDRTVAIWDVGEGYRKLSLKVPMPALHRGSELHFMTRWVLGARDAVVVEIHLDVLNGADTSVGKDGQKANKNSSTVMHETNHNRGMS